jgi:hypothetical protein
MAGRKKAVFRDLGVIVSAAVLSLAAQAQMAAFLDLTQGSRVPSEHLSVSQTCEKPNSSIAEMPAQAGGESESKALQLTIVEILPAKLEIGNDFTATVRLKNTGDAALLLPEIPDGERVLRTSTDRTEEKYDVGDVSFRLLTGKHTGIPVILDSAGALFADPEDKSSYLTLAPGKWLDIRLHGRVECGLENCAADIHADDAGVLTAWWYERVLSHRVSGCNETHGSSKVREVDSAPFKVVVRNPPSKPVPSRKLTAALRD